jgi:hypothetical protein
MKLTPLAALMFVLLIVLIALVIAFRAFETPAVALPLYLGIFISVTVLLRTMMGNGPRTK